MTTTLNNSNQECLRVQKKLKSLFITLPQRDQPDTFPPFGPMAIITYLKKAGYKDTSFYHVDLLRPSKKDMINYIVKCNLDVLCISAPVSTAYKKCKEYTLEIKGRLPHLTIILGGNLAASAEIILRKTGVDICILGEGEISCLNIFNKLSENKYTRKFEDAKGVAYLQGDKFINTGYAEQLPNNRMLDIDWDILGAQGINHCFPNLKDSLADPINHRWLYSKGENIVISSTELNQTMVSLALSRGCVARCTFCHRFQKGIRFVPKDLCITRIKMLIKKYNVGIFCFADECFGADIKWLKMFCEAIKPLNIKWKAGGMRVDKVNPEIIQIMKDSGCRAIIYGMETGSERILKIMEKRTLSKQNFNAVKWTTEAGLYTIPQFVIGMPGETPETIKETADFAAYCLTLDKSQNFNDISINYAQALPGTPLYEYARAKRMIGSSLAEEEKYLLQISNRDAKDSSTTLNFTEYSRLTLLSWRNIILCIVKYRYAKKFGMQHYYKVAFANKKQYSLFAMIKNKYFAEILTSYPVLVYRLRHFMWLFNLGNIYFKEGGCFAMTLLKEFIFCNITQLWRRSFRFDYKSLRKINEQDMPNTFLGIKEMVPLRKGR